MSFPPTYLLLCLFPLFIIFIGSFNPTVINPIQQLGIEEQGRFSRICMDSFETIRNKSLFKLTEAVHVTDCSEMLFSNYEKKYKAAENLRKYHSLKKSKVDKQIQLLVNF